MSYEVMKIKSDGNDGYVISRGLGWFLALIFPLITGLAGFGLSQVTDLALLEKRVSTNESSIAKLELWGPSTGDRYTAESARRDWAEHEDTHREQFVVIIERLARLEALIKE